MKLFNLAKSREVSGEGEQLIATHGPLVGSDLILVSVEQPGGLNPQGLIHFTLKDDKEPAETHPIIPRLAGCCWIGDESLMASVSYDNEDPLHVTIDQIFESVQFNSHEILSIYVGEKEWGKLTATNRVQFVDNDAIFHGVKLVHVNYFESALIIEHKLKSTDEP